MKTIALSSPGFLQKVSWKKGLIVCGILSSILYVTTDMLAKFLYENYSYIDQNYCELLASGAPARLFLLKSSVVYNMLVVAFAIGIWIWAGSKRIVRVTSAMMILYALLSMVTPLFFPMDKRFAEVTSRGSLHGLMTAVMSLFILLSIGFGAFLLGKRFRIYSFITIITIIFFGVLTSLQAPALEAGQPTPWMGFTERINIYTTMLWFAVLAIGLLRSENDGIRSKLCNTPDRKPGQWIALALCAAQLVAGVIQMIIPDQLEYARSFAPGWISLAAAVFAAAGIIWFNERSRLLLVQRGLLWIGLLLMVWTANGLPFDLLRLTPLMPQGVDWAGLFTRSLALAAVVSIAPLALSRPSTSKSNRTNSWFGYAAFVLALPYPIFRTCWAFGSTVGLKYPGAAGSGFAPMLIAIPWIMAAALSLLLVSPRTLIPRRLLLFAGWSATIIVAMIGPAAFWSVVTRLIEGGDLGSDGIANWVFCLFYGSWFLWAIAACGATRSYQLRSIGTLDDHRDVMTLPKSNISGISYL